LIGLSWYEGEVDGDGNFTRKPDYHTASAFVADIADTAWIVTAGHVINDHRERCRERPNWKASKHRVWDIWGPLPKVKEPVPYDFFDSKLITIPLQSFERGVDLALIRLERYLFQFLNQSLTPFMRADWIDSIEHVEHDYSVYYIVGTPNDLLHQDVEADGNRSRVTTYERPTIVAVEPIEDHGIETVCRQFVAKIHPSFPIEDIGGMSGGPILGFRKDGDGNLRYWPVAVQSRWQPSKRIVIGTYLSPWLKQAEQFFREQAHPAAK
jgi:hypothetical protein